MVGQRIQGGRRRSHRPDLLTEYGLCVHVAMDVRCLRYPMAGEKREGVLFCVRDSRREMEPQMDGCHVMVERALDERPALIVIK